MSSKEVRDIVIAILAQFLGGLLATIVYNHLERQGFGIIAIGLIAIIVLALLVLIYVYIRRMELARYWFLAVVITSVCYALLIVGYQFLNDKYVLIPALWILVGMLLPVHVGSLLTLFNLRW